ncbi:MAG: FkbM family methyltransferase [Chitinophagaceae bacterium]
MKKIYIRVRALALSFLDLLTRKRGVSISFHNRRLRVPGRYYRYFSKNYEQENFQFLEDSITPGTICLDIGAHIGLYTVFMAKKDAVVFSFEPSPASFQWLKKMVALNHCENKVTLLPKAVTGFTGYSSFYLNHSLRNGRDPIQIAEANSLVNVDFGPTLRKEEIRVETVSIDDFILKNNIKPGFIKIDVEGAELEVLEGAAKTIMEHRPSGIISVHNFAFSSKEESLSGIWQLMQQYRLIVLKDKQEMNREKFLSMTSELIFDFQFRPRP